MRTMKRIFPLLGITLCCIVFVLSAAGSVGVWFARAEANRMVNLVFDTADEAMAKVSSPIDVMLDNHNQLRDTLKNLTTEVEKNGKKVENSPVVLQKVDEMMNGELFPKLVKLNQITREVYAQLLKLESTLNTMSKSFLFRDSQGMVSETATFVTGVISGMDEIDAGFIELTGTIQAKKETLAEALPQTIEKVDARIAASQTRLTEIKTWMQVIEPRLAEARKLLLWKITIFSILISLLMVWLAFSQYVIIRSLWKTYQSNPLDPAP